MRVQVAMCRGPRDVAVVDLDMPDGCTVADAVRAAGFAVPPDAALGIWNRKADATQVLRADDRVEIYRRLLVDPKVARRERFAQQGRRGAGLFSARAGRSRS